MEHSLTASAYTNNLTTSFSTTRPTNQSTSMATLQPLTNRSTTLANSTLSATSGLKTTMTSPLMNVSIYATKNQPSVVSSVHTPTKGNPAEQSRAEQSRAEQSRAEQSRAESSWAAFIKAGFQSVEFCTRADFIARGYVWQYTVKRSATQRVFHFSIWCPQQPRVTR